MRSPVEHFLILLCLSARRLAIYPANILPTALHYFIRPVLDVPDVTHPVLTKVRFVGHQQDRSPKLHQGALQLRFGVNIQQHGTSTFLQLSLHDGTTDSTRTTVELI